MTVQSSLPPPPPPPVLVVPKRPTATAAFVCGVVGSVIGMIPIFGLFAIPLGIIAVVFGFMGWRERRRLARVAFFLGLLSIALGVAGFIIVQESIEDIDACVENVENC